MKTRMGAGIRMILTGLSASIHDNSDEVKERERSWASCRHYICEQLGADRSRGQSHPSSRPDASSRIISGRTPDGGSSPRTVVTVVLQEEGDRTRLVLTQIVELDRIGVVHEGREDTTSDVVRE
jgi:hypothetical protein